MSKPVDANELDTYLSLLEKKKFEVEEIKNNFNRALVLKKELFDGVMEAIKKIDELNKNNTSAFINLDDYCTMRLNNSVKNERKLIGISKSGIVEAENTLGNVIDILKRLGMKKEFLSQFENLRNGFKYCEKKIPFWEDRLTFQENFILSKNRNDYDKFKKMLEKELTLEKKILVERRDVLSHARYLIDKINKNPYEASLNFFFGGMLGAALGMSGVMFLKPDSPYALKFLSIVSVIGTITFSCLFVAASFDDYNEKFWESYIAVYGLKSIFPR